MDFEQDIDAEELELEIAGFDVTCLVWDQDDVEAAVRSLALFPQFKEHFKGAFDLINTATSFWLEEGSYSPGAELIRRAKIKAAAEQIISGRKSEKRSLTDAELTNLLFDQADNGTKKTIREHLIALGLRPLK
ncbi:hypothetical protein [Pseudomonas proteolytica]|uniref:hypothetical protein n=1 Tax=Pseudomonas proteolytica TaxID=219574 RepID=UPI0030EEE648